MGIVEGLTEVSMSGEVVAEKKFSDEESVVVNTAVEWKAKATREEYVFGIRHDFPIDKEGVQRDSLQQKK